MPNLFLLLLSLLLVSSVAYPAEPEQPQRIVSLSLCSDELLLALADRDAIASLTWLAAEPAFSPVFAEVQNTPLNHGLAEEVLQYEPDLIISTAFSATGAVRILRELNHEVEVLDLPASLDEVFKQITQAAALVGQEDRGSNLISALEQDISRSREIINEYPKQKAVFLSVNGVSYGRETLRDDFLKSIEWENLATTLGLNGTGRLSLEQLITARPDVVILNTPQPEDAWLASPLLNHPALEQVLEQAEILYLPDAWFQCAGPAMVNAWTTLASQLEQQAVKGTSTP